MRIYTTLDGTHKAFIKEQLTVNFGKNFGKKLVRA